MLEEGRIEETHRCIDESRQGKCWVCCRETAYNGKGRISVTFRLRNGFDCVLSKNKGSENECHTVKMRFAWTEKGSICSPCSKLQPETALLQKRGLCRRNCPLSSSAGRRKVYSCPTSSHCMLSHDRFLPVFTLRSHPTQP